MRSVTIDQRRAALVTRHHLAGDAADPQAVVDALVALHATDPATVYLSVLARSRASSIADLAKLMYDTRDLVRWMAMRRTLFLFSTNDIPLIQAAVSAPVAEALRRRLISLIERNGITPAVDDRLPEWLARVEEQVDRAVLRRGAATGAELRTDVVALRGTIPARTPSETPHGLTSLLLTVMSTEGRLVRGAPTGAWTTRGHRWEPVAHWWPDGLPRLEAGGAQTALARRWLERYGPAAVEDLEWWTGWNKTTTRRAIAPLDLEHVDLHGRPGIDLADRAPVLPVEPVATLLPALDPTPMGWKHRGWFTAVEPAPLYDAAGNIGPTIWWDGAIVGSWASTPAGIRTRIRADRGRHAADAVQSAADQLLHRLEGASVTPAARTPLERALSAHADNPEAHAAEY